jgi:hypothetical protein
MVPGEHPMSASASSKFSTAWLVLLVTSPVLYLIAPRMRPLALRARIAEHASFGPLGA